MIEADFDISPPGLRGLNRLATKLNVLMTGKKIADWHLGRWSDEDKTKHSIQFDNDEDAAKAKAGRGGSLGDMMN